jgi:hypothetical protein
MANALKTIAVEPVSEVAEVLSQAARAPILVESRGVRYRVVREGEDPFENYDPERARAGAERAFGRLVGLDVDAFLAEIKEQRAQDSLGRPA